MKKSFQFVCSLLFISTLLSSSLQAQENLDRLIRVQKILGVEAYFLSEPLREYEVVFDKNTGLNASSYFTGGLVNESISDKAAKFVKRVVKEGQKQNKTFDAVIYTSGKQVVAVKFTDEATAENKGIGRVQIIQDKLQVYILGEPLKDYDVINQKKGGIKGKSLITGGLVNNSIEQDINKIARKLSNEASYKKQKLDAVIYSGGKSAVGVRFK